MRGSTPRFRQRYRSGHNGADSKSVCRQLHVGSNPTRCATSEQSPLCSDVFLCLRQKDVIRPLPCSYFPTVTRFAGLAAGAPPCGRLFTCGEISFLTVPSKTKGHPFRCPFVLGSTRPWPPHPFGAWNAWRKCIPHVKRFCPRQNAGAAQTRRGPEVPLGRSLVGWPKFKHIDLNRPSKKEGHPIDVLPFWHCGLWPLHQLNLHVCRKG